MAFRFRFGAALSAGAVALVFAAALTMCGQSESEAQLEADAGYNDNVVCVNSATLVRVASFDCRFMPTALNASQLAACAKVYKVQWWYSALDVAVTPLGRVAGPGTPSVTAGRSADIAQLIYTVAASTPSLDGCPAQAANDASGDGAPMVTVQSSGDGTSGEVGTAGNGSIDAEVNNDD